MFSEEYFLVLNGKEILTKFRHRFDSYCCIKTYGCWNSVPSQSQQGQHVLWKRVLPGSRSAGLDLSGLVLVVQEGGRLGGEGVFLAGGPGGGALWLKQRETLNDGWTLTRALTIWYRPQPPPVSAHMSRQRLPIPIINRSLGMRNGVRGRMIASPDSPSVKQSHIFFSLLV
jgi:hypothetical protein